LLLVAAPRGFCAGVVRAIDLVERALSQYGPPIYVRHAIVHNPSVIARFENQGVVFVEELDEVPRGAIVIFSAHGVAKYVSEEARRRNLFALDATCPLVTKVHREVEHYVGNGCEVLLIGHPGHPEVFGTMGRVPEGTIRLVDSPETARNICLDLTRDYAYAQQTTLAIDEAEQILAILRARLPRLRGPAKDDICFATTNRQQAVSAIAPRCDALIVVGGKTSANSRRLVEIAERSGCQRSLLLEHPSHFDLAWLDGVRVLGLSSGASTPEDLLEGLLSLLRASFEVDVQRIEVMKEKEITFRLPPMPDFRGAAPAR
jgi:4-hydroxy-3-methylbut-2-enyl diphosphate reductase